MVDEATNYGGMPQIVRDPNDGQMKGLIQIARGTEPKPCYLCKSFEQDNRKLVQHLLARGLKADKDGCFETPLAHEVEGRHSLKLNPINYGYCRRDCIVTGMNSTCGAWRPTLLREDLAGKIGR